MTNKGMIGEIVETRRIRAEKLSFEWRIRDLPSLSSGNSDSYESPKFKFNDWEWFLMLKLNSRERVSVDVIYDTDDDPTETFSVEVGIKGSRGLIMNTEADWMFWDNSGPTGVWIGSAYFCSSSVLSSEKSKLMPDGLLTFTCVIKSIVNLAARGGVKANEDFAKLLGSGEHSDLTVQVGEVEFKVHRVILAARSPVLSAMFQHQTSEKASNKIVIEDCEPDIFKDFLHYIYAGSVKPLDEQDVFGLYRVTDKYLADDLKLQCLELLENTLCLLTFCDTVKFALVHNEIGLLDHAVEFASKNIRLIIRSEEWQNFIREFPAEANEILIRSLGTQSSNQNIF